MPVKIITPPRNFSDYRFKCGTCQCIFDIPKSEFIGTKCHCPGCGNIVTLGDQV